LTELLWNMAASYQLEEGRVDWQAGQLYGYGGLVEGTNSSLETFQTSPADRVATGQTDWGLLSGLELILTDGTGEIF
jgi:hypothetical protein